MLNLVKESLHIDELPPSHSADKTKVSMILFLDPLCDVAGEQERLP